MEPSIRMVFGRGYELMAKRPCKADLHTRSYWRKRADDLLASTNAVLVVLANRGDSRVRYEPADQDCIMMVASTSGRWSKPRLIRWGKNVQRRKRV